MKIQNKEPFAARKQRSAINEHGIFHLSILLFFVVLLYLSGCKKDTSIFPDGVPNNFLSAKSYKKLVIEIQYVQGFQPTQQTIDNLTNFLRERLNKPEGISVVTESIPSPGKNSYTLTDITSIESGYRTQRTQGNTITAYFLFVDKDYASNPSSGKVLGMAYDETSMVIFEKTITDYSGGLGQPTRDVLESTVVEHEFGHILGLVNNGTRMLTDHQDAANGRHCNNRACLMYYSTETSNIVANLLGGNIPQFDSNCLNDLRGNGGK
ncbi:MAG: peptidase [Bacteroidia bacterium]